MNASNAPAVLLVSGGLDSATVLAIARDQGYACHAVSFDYQQRHRHELVAAKAVCDAGGVASHRIISLDPSPFSGSALTDGGPVPMDRSEQEMSEGIPETYVPARNLVFLSYALGIAEGLGALDIFIGVNAIDYSGYPDCRGEFLESFQQDGESRDPHRERGLRGRPHPRPVAGVVQGPNRPAWPRTRCRPWTDDQLLRTRRRWRAVRSVRCLQVACERICRGGDRGSTHTSMFLTSNAWSSM